MYNDRMAAGGLHALRALGLRVPEDIAVVGSMGSHSVLLPTRN